MADDERWEATVLSKDSTEGGAPHFLDSVDRQLLCSSLGVKTAQIDERGLVAEG